jgi:putative transposase
MTTKRKHSSAEIAAMLAQANEMAAQGKLQSEIAETLGISVMTLHRWRKATPAPHLQIGQFEEEVGQSQRISELQLENSRLRRLVTDLLLEKMNLEESIRGGSSPADRTKVNRQSLYQTL